MPKILDRLVNQLKSKGHDQGSSFAIATKALQKSGNLKPGTQEPTAKGVERGNMTPEERKKSREEKYAKKYSKGGPVEGPSQAPVVSANLMDTAVNPTLKPWQGLRRGGKAGWRRGL